MTNGSERWSHVATTVRPQLFRSMIDNIITVDVKSTEGTNMWCNQHSGVVGCTF